MFKTCTNCSESGKVHQGTWGGEDCQDETGYLFLFTSGVQDLCINAQTFPWERHPSQNKMGRKMNHSKRNFNVKSLYCTMIFPEGESKEICFDYGERKTGPGIFEWLIQHQKSLHLQPSVPHNWATCNQQSVWAGTIVCFLSFFLSVWQFKSIHLSTPQ